MRANCGERQGRRRGHGAAASAARLRRGDRVIRQRPPRVATGGLDVSLRLTINRARASVYPARSKARRTQDSSVDAIHEGVGISPARRAVDREVLRKLATVLRDDLCRPAEGFSRRETLESLLRASAPLPRL